MASAVTVHAGHVAGGGVPHGAVEVVAGALTIEHARGGVVEEAGGKVGNAKHLHNIASWVAVSMPVNATFYALLNVLNSYPSCLVANSTLLLPSFLMHESMPRHHDSYFSTLHKIST